MDTTSVNVGAVFQAWLKKTLGSGPGLGIFGPIFDNAITTILGVIWMAAFVVAIGVIILNVSKLFISRGRSNTHEMNEAQGTIIWCIIGICVLIVFLPVMLAIAQLMG